MRSKFELKLSFGSAMHIIDIERTVEPWGGRGIGRQSRRLHVKLAVKQVFGDILVSPPQRFGTARMGRAGKVSYDRVESC